MTVKHFPHNERGKDYIVGDLHGHVDLLYDALNHLKFDPLVDRVFATGDLIDRGPHNLECLMLLDQPWFHSVKGNHEQMAEHSHISFVRDVWFKNGGTWAASVMNTDSWMAHKDAISSLPTAIVVGEGRARYNIVHAAPRHISGYMTDKAFDDTPVPELEADELWSRDLFYYPDQFRFRNNLSFTFVGHSPANMLVRAGPIYFLDRHAHHSYGNPTMCLAIACPQEWTIYEYYPMTDEIKSTLFEDVPDMSLPTFEEDYVYYKPIAD